MVHIYRSAAHWFGQVLSVTGTYAASCGGVATAKALQTPTQATEGFAVGLNVGALALHLASAFIAGEARMFDFESFENDSEFSRLVATKWVSSVLTTPLTGVSAGLFAYSAQLPATDPNKSLCQVWGSVGTLFAVAAVGSTHVAGALIKLNGDVAASFGPYFGRFAA